MNFFLSNNAFHTFLLVVISALERLMRNKSSGSLIMHQVDAYTTGLPRCPNSIERKQDDNNHDLINYVFKHLSDSPRRVSITLYWAFLIQIFPIQIFPMPIQPLKEY